MKFFLFVFFYFQSFRPPFAVERDKFEFIPRVQNLNQLEGITRPRAIFTAQLHSYWHLQGYKLLNPIIESRYVDFYRLSRVSFLFFFIRYNNFFFLKLLNF